MGCLCFEGDPPHGGFPFGFPQSHQTKGTLNKTEGPAMGPPFLETRQGIKTAGFKMQAPQRAPYSPLAQTQAGRKSCLPALQAATRSRSAPGAVGDVLRTQMGHPQSKSANQQCPNPATCGTNMATKACTRHITTFVGFTNV